MQNEPSPRRGRPAASHRSVACRIIVPETALIQTRDGALPAQHLTPGDDLVARTDGYVTLSTLRRRRMVLHLIWIKDGFLPGMEPAGGLFLPARERVVIRRSGQVEGIPAQSLVQTGLAQDVGLRRLAMIELGLSVRDSVLAGGLELAGRALGRSSTRRAA